MKPDSKLNRLPPLIPLTMKKVLTTAPVVAAVCSPSQRLTIEIFRLSPI